ncbi:MAG TPA: DUF4331 family protein [Pseudonocardiaceae bacterium]|jgi:hypothetical protein|nr:DUF4331 family protein [Pseudonocardiaceae bacterium]
MSNHFTGLKLGFPQGDARLDLTDLYVFTAPADPSRTVLVLNSNTFAKAPYFYPGAVYRINVDNNGDSITDVAFSFVFGEPVDGRQTVTVVRSQGALSRRPEPLGETLFTEVAVSLGAEPAVAFSGPYQLFAGVRSDPFILDFAGTIKDFAWTGEDLFADKNVFAIVLELPTSDLRPRPNLGVWGRLSVRQDGELVAVDRAGHPAVAGFFIGEGNSVEYNAVEPEHDMDRFLAEFLETLEHIGGYSPDEARAAIAAEGLLPDLLSFDPAAPAGYPNGRALTDHSAAVRAAMLSRGAAGDDGLTAHTDLLTDFPYLGSPHAEPGAIPAYGADYGW